MLANAVIMAAAIWQCLIQFVEFKRKMSDTLSLIADELLCLDLVCGTVYGGQILGTGQDLGRFLKVSVLKKAQNMMLDCTSHAERGLKLCCYSWNPFVSQVTEIHYSLFGTSHPRQEKLSEAS